MRSLALGAAVVLLAAGCSASTEACAQAALALAETELRLTEAYATHAADHESGANHDDAEVLDARVEMILAEAETRRACA